MSVQAILYQYRATRPPVLTADRLVGIVSIGDISEALA
jgi:CBS domain-containing protein